MREKEKERMDFVVGCGPIFAKSSFFFSFHRCRSYVMTAVATLKQTNKQTNKKI
jgi:hypothetical protein